MFVARGGNVAVNRQWTTHFPTLPSMASRADIDRYIAAKYQGAQLESRSLGAGGAHGSQAVRSESLHSDASRLGTTCHQGLVFAEVLSVELASERVKDLRMHTVFLNLTIVLSLGPIKAERTSSRRGTQSAAWEPPERRELLWDAEERWLRCRVYDGGLTGNYALAAQGRIDLLELIAEGCGTPELLTVELFAPAEKEDGDEESASEEDSEDRVSCGEASLQLTIIDMTGMMSSQEKKGIRKAPTTPADTP